MINHAIQPCPIRRGQWRRACAIVLIGTTFVGVTACASSGGAIEVDQLKGELQSPSSQQYVIGVGDLLSVQVYSDEKLSGRMKVRSDGKISVGFLNDVQAAGKTPVQLTSDLESGLASVILSPRVTVVV